MSVFEIIPREMPPAQEKTPYGFFFSAINGVEPFRFKVVRGRFPEGMSLGPEGFLHGTPQGVGPYTVTIEATDAHHSESSYIYKFVVEPEPRPMPVKGPKTDGSDPQSDA